MASTLKYSMPRGDTRVLTVALPISTWTAGCHLYFTIKPIDDVDAANTDGTAVCEKTLSDSEIVSTDAVNKNYVLTLNPLDTFNIVPGVYRAEIEYVSADQSVVLTYPDPSVATWYITITGDVTRRTV